MHNVVNSSHQARQLALGPDESVVAVAMNGEQGQLFVATGSGSLLLFALGSAQDAKVVLWACLYLHHFRSDCNFEHCRGASIMHHFQQ